MAAQGDASIGLATGCDPLSDTVLRQTDFDVPSGQCVVSHRNPACAVVIRHKTLSDGEVQVCLLHGNCLFRPAV